MYEYILISILSVCFGGLILPVNQTFGRRICILIFVLPLSILIQILSAILVVALLIFFGIFVLPVFTLGDILRRILKLILPTPTKI
jgi:hypothetical protein